MPATLRSSNLAVYAAQVLKVKQVAVIDDRTAFGQGVADQFTKEAKKQGLTVVGQEFTTDKSTDFLSILTSLKGKQPQAIFFGGYAPQAAPMARQMKQLGLTAKLLGGDTLCSPEVGKLGGDAVNDTVFCAQGGTMLDKAANGLQGQVQGALQAGCRRVRRLLLRPGDVHGRVDAKGQLHAARESGCADGQHQLPRRGGHVCLR